MTEQLQFSIGDDVQYVSSSKYNYRAPGTYRIVRLRPSETPDCQYWIRSALENFDRIAFHSELGFIPPTSTTRVARQFINHPRALQAEGIGKVVETDPAELEILTRSARHD